MHKVRQSEPIHPTHRQHDVTEQVSTIRLSNLERLYERPAALKQETLDPKRKDAYVSDFVNAQSLLNIRTTETRRNKRYTTLLLKDRIIINVCGDRFETHRTTLELYPDTLLGNHVRRKYYYDKIRNEYFFDRNRACFEAILYYYQSHGRIRRPPYVPIDVFLEEVAFFQLGAKALNEIRTEENIEEIKKVRLPKNRLLRHIWATMEYPSYSIIAKLVHILSLLMILVSTFSLAVESLPRYSSINDLACKKVHDVPNNTNRTDNNSSGDVYSCHTYLTSPFFLTQTGCVAFFTVELLLRIISTPSFIYFIKDIMNWIDVLAVVPYYITLIVRVADEENHIQTATYLVLRLLRIIRLARVLKFYRLFKSVKSLRVLAETFKQSIPDFLIMITILTLLGFLFGAGTYYAENETNGQAFDSILKATYWGIITITSVGYGDIYPTTPVGRVLSCLCALFGAATIGMLVSVLVDRYQRVFARKLYVNEEIIDFNDYSDDENNDTERNGSTESRRPNNLSKIEDPDARARANTAFEDGENDTTEITEISQIAIENSISRQNSQIHFIIGYVDDEKNQTARDLVDKISSIVTEKQTAGKDIQLNILSNERQPSPYDVKFQVSSSSEDDEEELTVITSGCENKGNVLKRFQRPPSPKNNNKKLDKTEKNV